MARWGDAAVRGLALRRALELSGASVVLRGGWGQQTRRQRRGAGGWKYCQVNLFFLARDRGSQAFGKP
jgi:hypothetical protein